MRFAFLLGTVVALTVASSAQAADQFDLACDGTRKAKSDGEAVPHKFGFRIDLQNKVWCWDHCEVTFPIAEVLPDRIIFTREDDDSYQRRRHIESWVSRRDGKFESIMIIVRPFPTFVETKGTCTVKPFTGFPKAMF
ncbi:hypothetical protein [Sphingomonas hankookensis]|uniref:hypothetical protein n=1 Tax=Sphingomonas hankookensis TaxID=563996 RepID=UPI00234F24BB|nr:hypothetical protein [Sphingomonas hankookensis]WCP71550.1 hypothetical protein PPZ50_14495 [Sphingomonas hankookensis]